MSLSEDLLSDLYECECASCHNLWWVPRFEALEDIESMPTFCCFCGREFDTYEMEE